MVMKKTKRQQNSMIINVVFNSLLAIVFAVIILMFIYPNMVQISSDKKEISQLSSDVTRIEKQGISFEEFSSLRTTSKDNVTDVFIQKLLDKVDLDFYNSNLSNTSSWSFVKQWYTSNTTCILKLCWRWYRCDYWFLIH